MSGPGALLVAGTASDAGKSVVTTGLCRALARRGVRVAPFKAQNMSNNSMVCTGPDGYGEIGRAQWIQAVAARVTPEVAMNPVLLKPGSDRRSHVVLNGRPAGAVDAGDWEAGRRHLAAAAYDAFDDLRSRFEVVVAEGAGSPTEINLRAGDYVNMGLARHGDVPTVVVGDIDRGGLFAALYGTVGLLEPADQALVAGFVVNKFRGEVDLLRPGLEELRQLTGRPAYGVLPWHPDLWLDSEDALDVHGRRDPGAEALRVAVVRFPRISNFTDVDALGAEPGVDVTFAAGPAALDDVDLVVLPGTRATIADLAWLRERGLDAGIARHVARGRSVLGICGGYQMLGERICDPAGVERGTDQPVPGLGLLPVETRFSSAKVLALREERWRGRAVTGYEIHHGQVAPTGARADVEAIPGGVRSGAVLGTLWHGCLESDGLREALLAEVAAQVGRPAGGWRPSGTRFAVRREARLDLLADLVEQHLDVEALLDLARTGAPPGLPVLPPGADLGGGRHR